MGIQAVTANNFLTLFEEHGNRKRWLILEEIPQSPDRLFFSDFLEQKEKHSLIYKRDFRQLTRDFSVYSRFEVASQMQGVTTVVAAIFAPFVDLYRAVRGEIRASVILENLYLVPLHIFKAVGLSAMSLVKSVVMVVNAACLGAGFIAWHAGEKVVNLFQASSTTVLSSDYDFRKFVYKAIGMTLLSAGALFIPIAPIQMIALPILIGSVYGFINNQFTVRDCPEYYTMGHHYDGERLRLHAVKTNNLIVKPMVTGCYATVLVTKYIGLLLAGVGTLPYVAAALPVAYVAAMIAGVCAISLVAAHFFARSDQQQIEKDLESYASHVGFQWTDELRNKTWGDLEIFSEEHILRKRKELEGDPTELGNFNYKLESLTNIIKENILKPHLPIRYIAPWAANNTRNGAGYFTAGAGAIAASIGIIVLRIFAL